MLFLRHNEPGQKLLARLEKKQGTGKALSILAHQLGRAVYDMLKRSTACDIDLFLKSEGRRAAEPGAELDSEGEAPASSTRHGKATASVHAKACLGR